MLPFVGGCVFSGILVLNHTYETELVKRQLRREIHTLRRMKDFELDQVAQFRKSDDSHLSSGEADLENMSEHYKYFWACSSNALRESIFQFQLTPILRYYRDETLKEVPEPVRK